MVQVGETKSVTACFEDPNGDMLVYAAATSDPGVAAAAVSGGIVAVKGMSPGGALVTVTATDVSGLTAELPFRVVVPNRAPRAVGTISALEVPAGESATVEVSGNFLEPDGESLEYAAASSDTATATVSGAGSLFTVAAWAHGTATVTVKATDSGGLTATQSFLVTVPNRMPVVVESMPAETVQVGETTTHDLASHFSDPDGDPLAYAAAVSDTALAEVSISRDVLSVTAIAKGRTQVTVVATDAEGLTAALTFDVTVPNRTPQAIGVIPLATVSAGETTTVDARAYFNDPDGDVLLYAAAISDSSVAMVSVAGSTVTVAARGKGDAIVTVTVTDAEGLDAVQQFVVTVPNRAPVAKRAIAALTLEAGETLGLPMSPHFDDPDGDSLVFAAVASDSAVVGVSVLGSSVEVAALGKGEAVVTVTVSDTEGLTAGQSFVVTVPNRMPVVVESMPAQTVQVGETTTHGLASYFSDPDGDPLAYSATVSDTTLAEVSVSRDILSVTSIAKGKTQVTVVATDEEGLTASLSFDVTVPNRAPQPIGAIPLASVPAGETTTVDARAYFDDPDGDVLLYVAAISDSTVAMVSVPGGTVMVTALGKGDATVTVTVTDAEGLAAVQQFVVTVPNRAPVALDPFPSMQLSKGGVARVDPTSHFADPDHDTLVLEVASSDLNVARTWVSNDQILIRGVNKGTATITITVRDPEGLATHQAFALEVRKSGGSGSDPNNPPVAVGTILARTLEEGDSRTLTASSYFSDPDDDNLTFEAVSSNTSVVVATATRGEVGMEALAEGTATVTITARDPEGLAANQTFAVEVSEPGPNRAPKPVGQIPEQTLKKDNSRTLTAAPYFSDPDGDALTFEASSSNTSVVVVNATATGAEMNALAVGTATVTITARDPERLDANQTFAVNVTEQGGSDANLAPVSVGIGISAQTLEVGDSRTWTASSYFSDPDDDELTFEASSSNTSVASVTANGAEVEMDALAEGTATVTITARDPEGLAANQTFAVEVTEQGGSDANLAPVSVRIGISAQTLEVGDSRTWTASSYFSDPDDDELTFEASSSNTSVASVTADGAEVEMDALAEGTATVTITARDPEGLSADLEFDVAVSPPPPPISICSRTPAIRDKILSLAGAGDCATVTATQLSSIGTLLVNNAGITALSSGDFAGLSGLWRLELAGNQLPALPSDVFSGLFYLAALDLSDNSLGTLPSGVFSGLFYLAALDLSDNSLGTLPSGVFADPTGMSDLLLNGNSLGELPDGVFHHLALLRTLWLHGNDVDPMPIEVSLESPADGTVKATVPSGAPFDIVIPIVVSNGTMAGDGTITIPIGHIESPAFEVSPLSNSQTSVTVDVGTLPDPPTTTSYTNSAGVTLPAHNGYTLRRSADLPLTVTVGQQEQQQPLPAAFLALPSRATSTSATTESVPASRARLTVAKSRSPNSSSSLDRVSESLAAAISEATSPVCSRTLSRAPPGSSQSNPRRLARLLCGEGPGQGAALFPFGRLVHVFDQHRLRLLEWFTSAPAPS